MSDELPEFTGASAVVPGGAPALGLTSARLPGGTDILGDTCSIAATAGPPGPTLYSAVDGAIPSLPRAGAAGLLRSGTRVDTRHR